jgi:hypothetical protein
MQDDPYVEIPDWLKELREPPPSSEEYVPESQPEEEQPDWLTPPPEPAAERESLLEGLREQAQDELEELEKLEKPRTGLAGALMGLSPVQRFILALLLFLDVALLGCMCLVMTQRIVPFP